MQEASDDNMRLPGACHLISTHNVKVGLELGSENAKCTLFIVHI
jgi:hypothetical protein